MKRVRKTGNGSRYLAALLGVLIAGACAQAQQAIVIEGGTLIDGNGGAPVRDSVVVIEGNKITRVGVKGQGAYPANARIINAAGKYVLPGLIEGQSSYCWYMGEAMLNYGVTSTLEFGAGKALTKMIEEGLAEVKPRAADDFKSMAGLSQWIIRSC